MQIEEWLRRVAAAPMTERQNGVARPNLKFAVFNFHFSIIRPARAA
jgi:hypothetical protein